MKLTGDFTDGPNQVLVDPVRPNDIYVGPVHDGVWKSTDCGFTFKKVSNGTNGSQLDTGGPWGAGIDHNPNRDPSTPPTLYFNQGYGAGGLWKSTDGGVNWINVWDNNIYAADGVTNISKDVGGDLAGVSLVSNTDGNHLIEFLHSYYGTGGNNGVFESKDGGGKWVVHATPQFHFQPHSDLLRGIDDNTWWVDHAATWPAGELWRTTDAGASWTKSGSQVSMGLGSSIARSGSIIYTGSDYHDSVYKTTDNGASWKKLPVPANAVGWVATTATKVYACSGYGGSVPHLLHASLADDTAWTDDGTPSVMKNCMTWTVGVIDDGSHHVLIVPDSGCPGCSPSQPAGGLLRYVEP
jgi:photosystem II stability/assembly factor-like uncharacterized protein